MHTLNYCVIKDIKLYKNGIIQGTSTNLTGNIDITTNKVGIGSNGVGAASIIFNGIINDVRIYNLALSANEISEYYESTKHVYL